jgi:hypothetical protein
MAVTYPLTLPAEPCPSRVTLVPSNRSAVTESPFSGQRQIQRQGFQAWRFTVEYPSMTKAQARQWLAALMSLEGQSGTFLFGDPVWKTPAGTWAGTPVVNGVGQTGSSLALSGFTAGATVKAGDNFQISSGEFARLHTVLTDAVADGSGLATLDIWPRHRSSPGSGDPVTASSPKGVFQLATDDFARNWDRPIYSLTLDIIEAIR